MNRWTKTIVASAVICGAVWIAPSSLAGEVSFRHRGPGVGETVRLLFRNDQGLQVRGQFFAGQRRMQVESGNYGPLYPGRIVRSFSIDIFHETGSGTAEVGIFDRSAEQWWDHPMPNLNQNRRDMIEHLYATQYQQVQSGGRVQAVAFQIALWEIATERGQERFSLDTGWFRLLRVREASKRLAEQWLDATLEAFEADALQSFRLLGANFLDDFEAQLMVIPAPPALLLGLAGLAGVSLRRRQRAASTSAG